MRSFLLQKYNSSFLLNDHLHKIIYTSRSGEDWEKKLGNHVPNKDIFYLFWSRFAANSKWVEREWRLALSKRGLDYIDPVPLEDIRDAPPPSELKALHFNDSYISYIEYEKSRMN